MTLNVELYTTEVSFLGDMNYGMTNNKKKVRLNYIERIIQIDIHVKKLNVNLKLVVWFN